MKARIVILPDGQISIFTEEGDFTEGATRDVVAIMPAPLTGPRIKVDLLDLNGEWLVVFADDPPHPVTQAAGLPEPESHHP